MTQNSVSPMHFPKIGTKAPDFHEKALVGSEFVDLSLEKFKGKYLVILFYPRDFSFVCPTELTALDKAYKDFKNLGCEVIAVSTDSVFSHLAWTEVPVKDGGIGHVQYPIIGDVSLEMSRTYNVLITEGENKGTALRGTFIIDKEQILRVAMYNDFPIGRSIPEIKRLLEALQHYEAHGEVCPVNWSAGQSGIVPNVKDSKAYFGNIKK